MNSLKLIDIEVIILSMLILLGVVLRLKYLLDYNKGKIVKFNNSLITLVLYSLLIFSYQIIGITSSNVQTLNYVSISGFMMLVPLIGVIILNSKILVRNWKCIENKKEQIIISILIIVFIFPFGLIVSVLTPIVSIVTILLEYLENISRGKV